jgi:hypothetical protein
MFFQSLFMSSLSLQFSKAVNLFEILIWYCFLTSSLLSFLRLNLCTSNYCAASLITVNHSLTFATTRWWSVTQSAHLKDRTSTIPQCHIYQCVIYLLVSLPIRRGPGVLVNVSVREHRALNQIFDVAKFTILTTLSLMSCCRLFIPKYRFQNLISPKFIIKIS